MENTITVQLTDTQVKTLEGIFDEFSQTMRRVKRDEPTRQERMTKLEAEIQLLLSQAEDDLNQIKLMNARQPKMLWEKMNVE